MGPVNWSAVVIGWLVAASLGVAFYGRRATPRPPLAVHFLAAVLLFASVAMVGHMFARVGSATLSAKPWLYFMMSGGLALTFIGPALVVTAARRDTPLRAALFDGGYFCAAFLSIGAVFWLMA